MTFKENIEYLHYFGMKLTFWKTINSFTQRHKCKISWKIKEKNNATIEKYITRICSQTYDKLEKNQNIELIEQDIVNDNIAKNSKLKNNVIWTMWWQGEKFAPEIVKACIASMRKNSNGHPVIVLDESNYSQYIKLPKEIIERYNNGKKNNSNLKKCVVDNTKISDIIRCALLSYYGGVWCDATVFFTDKVPCFLFDEEWSTLGQDDNWYIGNGKWCSFFMGCQSGNLLMKYTYMMHIEYFEKKEYWVNYLLIDYFIDLAYKNNLKIARMIDFVKTENKKCLTINRKYNSVVTKEEFEDFISCQCFHKLSWRWWGRDKTANIPNDILEKKNTWFGFLYNDYIKKLI